LGPGKKAPLNGFLVKVSKLTKSWKKKKRGKKKNPKIERERASVKTIKKNKRKTGEK